MKRMEHYYNYLLIRGKFILHLDWVSDVFLWRQLEKPRFLDFFWDHTGPHPCPSFNWSLRYYFEIYIDWMGGAGRRAITYHANSQNEFSHFTNSVSPAS